MARKSTTAGPEENTAAGPEENTAAGPEENTAAGPEENTAAGPRYAKDFRDQNGDMVRAGQPVDPDRYDHAIYTAYVDSGMITE